MFSIWRSPGLQYWGVMANRSAFDPVGPAAVKKRTVKDDHGTSGHQYLDGFSFSWLAVFRPSMAARNNLGCAVIFREVIKGPNCAHAKARARLVNRQSRDTVVIVKRLGRLAGMYQY